MGFMETHRRALPHGWGLRSFGSLVTIVMANRLGIKVRRCNKIMDRRRVNRGIGFQPVFLADRLEAYPTEFGNFLSCAS